VERRQPIFNVDRSVTGLIALLVAVHLVRSLIPAAWDEEVLIRLGLLPARYADMYTDIPGGTLAGITSFVTHMLLHGSWMHLVINIAWLLAFGGAVAKRLGGIRFLALFVLTGIAGAGFYLLLHWGAIALLIGASGGVSGMFGAAMRFLMPMLRAGGGEAGTRVPALSLRQLLHDRMTLVVVVAWLFLNLGFGLLGDPFGGTAEIAWEAHLGGFLAGLFGFGLFDRASGPPAVDTTTPEEH
jgi:membrane associated rhomboid family serine protease